MFAPIGSHVNENEKNIGKHHKIKNVKSQNRTYVRKNEKKIQEMFAKRTSKTIEGGVAF